MKNAYTSVSLLVISLLCAILLSSCSGGGDSEDIATALEDRLTTALGFEGASYVEGEAPAGAAGGDAPQIGELSMAGVLYLGAAFATEVLSDYSQAEQVDTVIVYVEGAAGYLEVPTELAQGMLTLFGTLAQDGELADEKFTLKFALQTSDDVTGSYVTHKLTVSAAASPQEEGLALEVDGAQMHNSPAPQGSSSVSAPQIGKVEAPSFLAPGQAVTVRLYTEFTEGIDGAILTLPSRDSYFEIPGQLEDGVFEISGNFVGNNTQVGDELSFLWALKSDAGEIGLYRMWVVTVDDEPSDGDPVEPDGDEDPDTDPVQPDGDEEIHPDGDEETPPDGDEEMPPDGDVETDGDEEDELADGDSDVLPTICTEGVTFCDDEDPLTVRDYCFDGVCVGQTQGVDIGGVCSETAECNFSSYCAINGQDNQGLCQAVNLITGEGGTQPVYSPDGRFVAAINLYLIRVWETGSWRLVREMSTLGFDNALVGDLAFTKDGNQLIGCSNPRVHVWQLSDGAIVKEIGTTCTSLAVSPDGTTLAMGGNQEAKLYDISNDYAYLRTATGHTTYVERLTFSHNGLWIATAGGYDDTAKVYTVADGQLVRSLDTGDTVYSVAFSNDDAYLAVSTYNPLKLYDTSDWSNPTTKYGQSQVMMAFSADNQTLYTSGFGQVMAYAMPGLTDLTPIPAEGMISHYFYPSPDGQQLAGGDPSGGLRIWNWADGVNLLHLPGIGGYIYSMDVSIDGQKLYLGGSDEITRVITMSDGTVNTELPAKAWVMSQISSGPLLAVRGGNSSDEVHIWNINTVIQDDTLTGHSSMITALDCSHDGLILASGGFDDMIKLWSMTTFGEIRTIDNLQSVNRLAFSPDELTLASGSHTGGIKIWQISDGQSVDSWYAYGYTVQDLAYSPDGALLISGEEYAASADLWRVSDHASVRSFTGFATGQFTSAVFSPDGRIVAIGLDSGAVHLYSTGTGDLLRAIEGQATGSEFPHFSPDGQSLITDDDAWLGIVIRTYDISDIITSSNVECGDLPCMGGTWCNEAINHCVPDGCDDGIDNDEDGYTDSNDVDCNGGKHLEYRDDGP